MPRTRSGHGSPGISSRSHFFHRIVGNHRASVSWVLLQYVFRARDLRRGQSRPLSYAPGSHFRVHHNTPVSIQCARRELLHNRGEHRHQRAHPHRMTHAHVGSRVLQGLTHAGMRLASVAASAESSRLELVSHKLVLTLCTEAASRESRSSYVFLVRFLSRSSEMPSPHLRITAAGSVSSLWQRQGNCVRA